jgi:trehalose synthase
VHADAASLDNGGGIRRQIQDRVNGFLVSSIDEAAEHIVEVLTNALLRQQLGQKARVTVAEHFLLTRFVEQDLDLLNAFEPALRLCAFPGKGQTSAVGL